MSSAYTIHPLGDQALTFQLAAGPDPEGNDRVLAMSDWLLHRSLPGLLDVQPAYNSLTVYFDPWRLRRQAKVGTTAYDWVRQWVEAAYTAAETRRRPGRAVELPVCYDPDFGFDLAFCAAALNCSPEEVVRRHAATVYRVYLLGFLPGFPYLGELPPDLRLPRKARPGSVPAGSVAIAGRQTGIYPFDSPGGWQVLGRTPLKMFDPAADPPTLLQAGDRVRFYPIDRRTYHGMLS